MDRLERQLREELGRLTPTGTGAADMVAIVRAWPAAVGPDNARRSWPARVARDGTLHAHAADSVWAFQLGMLAEQILARLREHLGEATPPALRFAAGPLPEPPAETSPRVTGDTPTPTPEHVAEAASLAAAIGDETLRRTVARAAAASLARARSGRAF